MVWKKKNYSLTGRSGQAPVSGMLSPPHSLAVSHFEKKLLFQSRGGERPVATRQRSVRRTRSGGAVARRLHGGGAAGTSKWIGVLFVSG